MAALVLSSEPPRFRSCSASNRIPGSWAMPASDLSSLRASRTSKDLSDCGAAAAAAASLGNSEAWKDLDNIAALGLSLHAEGDKESATSQIDIPQINFDDGWNIFEDTKPPRVTKPFHKWIKTLQRRAHRPRNRRRGGSSSGSHEFFPPSLDDSLSNHRHRKSSSDSSFGYVTGVRSASISLAGSAMTRSKRNTVRSSRCSRTERSSRASYSRTRFSEESTRCERTISVDPAVTERQLQRRRVIEELISTEESYIGDIKFLMNVYVTILASLPTQHQGLRSSINRNLTDIVELHEEILGELHRVVPNSEYTQLQQIQPAHKPPTRPNHQRWYSLDSVPEVKDGTPWLQDVPGMVAEPTVAADVAQVFGDRMYRFFVYEEYGAKYEMMIKDVASTHRAMPQWETYQKGLEALAASLGSANHHVDRSRKSLTIGDLLVKPIQRICRYPLLFAELLKHTPVYDCPNSHAQIENVLVRLREATAEINRATDDPSVKVTVEKTWLLQDRLIFPDQSFDTNTKANVRLLGQIQLCGTLHVCWQTRKAVKGQYMICLLYRDSLCLATAEGLHQVYTIQACIGLNTIKLEEADNGRGLQCHTAPFSWKLVFEIDHQLYEIIMTACTPKEEMEWRTRLTGLIPNEPHDHPEAPLCSSLSLDIKSLGTVFGKPGTVARRLSIHRATTVGPKSSLCQVILKNTTLLKDPASAGAVSPINRSQSLLTTNSRIPILSPGRGERARLEALLADVWSRTVLPFPGITNRSKSEYLVRSSASAMKRKLSVASITNTFLKRTPSTTSVGKAREKLAADRASDRDHHAAEESSGQARTTAGSPTLVCDFSTPELSLEDDFDYVQGRLPVICDDVERVSSSSPNWSAFDEASVQGTVRKADPSRLEPLSVAKRQQDEATTSVLVTSLSASPANSLRPSRTNTQSVKSLSPVSTDRRKENVHHMGHVETDQLPHEPAPTLKTGSKWTKVGMLNRGLKTGGLRSLFR
ncbi:Dbl homology domain-containing protein [Apiospora arundinis]|uniref:Dbl homology domain-containing protein n=1 Tax=Apiospora arundinis TaxID=335852 RepID=A0ABR2J801_9PEZI